MILCRLGEPGAERPAALFNGQFYDISATLKDLEREAFDPETLRLLETSLQFGEFPLLRDAERMRVGAAVSRPGSIICIGMNYAEHAAESGAAPPDQPIMFLKTPSSIAGPFDQIDLPRGSGRTDWEVELGVVIGTRALYLESPSQARAHVAGYVLANDLSERTWQLEESGGQWSKGKCAPGFLPLGPWFVTADVVDPGDLRLRSWVNGEPRQVGTTSNLIFGVDFLVWHLSQFLALEPGDLILTGTPAGVALSGRFPYLKAGDVVELEIDGLGRQRQVFGQA